MTKFKVRATVRSDLEVGHRSAARGRARVGTHLWLNDVVVRRIDDRRGDVGVQAAVRLEGRQEVRPGNLLEQRWLSNEREVLDRSE